MLVFGAGEGGVQTITAMLRNPNSAYLPVAMLDDDPAKRNLRLRGVRVVGGRDALARAAADYDASTVVMAMPGASSELLRELCELATDAHLDIRVLPAADRAVRRPHRRGRHPPADRRRPARAPRDRHRRERHRRLPDRPAACWSPAPAGPSAASCATSCPASRPPPWCWSTATSPPSTRCSCAWRVGPCSTAAALVVADVRDGPRMIEVFEEHRPQVVFHAAALKHLPLLEMHPCEAIKTNVIGTQNVLVAARHVRGRSLREHLHRQGRRPHQRAGLHQAHLRAADRGGHQRGRSAPT